MTKLARRRRAPGLLAFEGDEVVGWVAVAPRTEFARIENSRATPRVDDKDVWVIPCVTVRKTARGSGIASALIRAAAEYALEHGACAVEAYPRAGAVRTVRRQCLVRHRGHVPSRGIPRYPQTAEVPSAQPRAACDYADRGGLSVLVVIANIAYEFATAGNSVNCPRRRRRAGPFTAGSGSTDVAMEM